MDLEYLISLIKTAGPHMALVLYFVWQGQRRERRLEDRQKVLEVYILEELTAVSKGYTAQLERNTSVLERVLTKIN